MAIVQGNFTSANSGNTNVTSIAVSVPSGVTDGDVLEAILVSNNATGLASFAGWTSIQNATTTGLSQSSFWRMASSEGATWTFTGLTSARWSVIMRAWSGADNVTPLDVAVPTRTAGTTSLTFPAVTPVTAGCRVLSHGAVLETSNTEPTWTAGNMTGVDNHDAAIATGAINAFQSVARFGSWASGSFTPTGPAATGTKSRTVGTTWVLRPLTAVVATRATTYSVRSAVTPTTRLTTYKVRAEVGPRWSDNFNRADQTVSATGAWVSTGTTAPAQLQIVSNQVQGGTANGASRYNQALPSTSIQYSAENYQGSTLSGPAVAMTAFSEAASFASSAEWYWFCWSGTQFSLRQKDIGVSSSTILASAAGTAPSVNDSMFLTYDGTVINCYADQVLVITHTPASPLSRSDHNYVGLSNNTSSNSGLTLFDGWTGGDYTLRRLTTWKTAQQVIATRGTTYSVRTAVTPATRLTTWNVTTSVTPTTRLTTYKVAQQITATRSTTYKVVQQIAATRLTTYSVRTAITPATRSTTYKVAQQITATRLTTYKVAQQVVKTNLTTWSVKSSITPATRTTTWNTRTVAAQTVVTTWRVASQVPNATRLTTYKVAQQVTATRAASWNTKSSVTATRSTTYAVKTSVTQTRSTTWAVRQAITATRSTTWAVRSAVAPATRLTTYNVRSQTAATRATTWNTKQQVVATRAASYAVKTSVSTTRSTTYAVRAQVVKSQDTTWNTSGATTTIIITRSTTWNVVGRIVTTQNTFWAVKTALTATRITTWRVAAVAATTRSTTWSVKSQVIALRATTYAVRTSAATTRATTWSVKSAVSTTRLTTYKVRYQVIDTAPTSWAVGQAVSLTTTTTWNIYVSIASSSTRSTTWSVREKVTTSSTTTWNIQVITQLEALVEGNWTGVIILGVGRDGDFVPVEVVTSS